MDGISQPAVIGFTPDIKPGQMQVPAGGILVGEDTDTVTRPSWAKGGSFLAFRQLQQRVPEFSQYLVDNALNVPGLSQQENADLLGARFIGRWKSVSFLLSIYSTI
jgi:deferrochelatase/peroxidase EfeB